MQLVQVIASPLYYTYIVSTLFAECNPDLVGTHLLLLKGKPATKAYIVYTCLVYKIIIQYIHESSFCIRYAVIN